MSASQTGTGIKGARLDGWHRQPADTAAPSSWLEQSLGHVSAGKALYMGGASGHSHWDERGHQARQVMVRVGDRLNTYDTKTYEQTNV